MLSAMLAGGWTVLAEEKSGTNEFLPRREYEKLKGEVEALKSMVEALVKKQTVSAQAPASSATPGSAASTTLAKSNGAAGPSGETRVASANSKPAPNGQNGNGGQNMQAVNKELSEGDRKKEAADAKRRLDEFLRTQKQLSRTGEFDAELGLSYSHDTAENTCFGYGVRFCQAGSQVTPKLTSQFASAALRFRYGLTDNMQLNLAVPFSYNTQEKDFTPFSIGGGQSTISSTDNYGIGDVSFGLRYAVWRENGWPDLTVNLNAKSNTGDPERGLGSGYWNAGGGFTLVKTVDPVVLFGSLGYNWTFGTDGVDPGSQISHGIGMGFSLNDRISFSTSLGGSYLMSTSYRGKEIAGSSRLVETLQFSTTVQVSDNLSVEPFVGIGLTNESPDFSVGINLPYRFDGRYPLPLIGTLGSMTN